MPPHDQRPVVARPTARAIVVDDTGRVLLFQVEDLPFPGPLDPDPKQPRIYWVTPGGGVEPGETFVAAACRELLEETGLVADQLGPCLIEEDVLLPKVDRTIHVHMRFFLVRVAAAEVSLAELAATTEMIDPPHLPEMLRPLAARLCLNVRMVNQQPEPPLTGSAHRLLERLTAVKTHVWMLRRRLRNGRLDPAEAEAHLDQIETQVDAAAALAANLHEQPSPPP